MGTVAERAMARYLSRLLLRSTLSSNEQSATVALQGRVVQLPARRDVVAPGQTIGFACLVAEGLLARFDQMRDGSRSITALHIPGDMADLHSVVSPTAGWGITALVKSTIVQVPHHSLIDIASRFPGLARAFWRDTTADAAILAKWVAIIGRKNALARVAHLLCEMGSRLEAAGIGSRELFELPLTQEQFGEVLGITGVHMNRTFRILRRENVAVINARMTQVLDQERLVAIADYDPSFLLFNQSTVH